jgi:MoxR-like ATPase
VGVGNPLDYRLPRNRQAIVPLTSLYTGLALPALRHKVVLSPAAEIEGRRVEQAIRSLIDQVPAPR